MLVLRVSDLSSDEVLEYNGHTRQPRAAPAAETLFDIGNAIPDAAALDLPLAPLLPVEGMAVENAALVDGALEEYGPQQRNVHPVGPFVAGDVNAAGRNNADFQAGLPHADNAMMIFADIFGSDDDDNHYDDPLDDEDLLFLLEEGI